MTATHDVDLLIVGAGPVGLYGAFYAGVRGLSVAVIDSLTEVGGQVSALYPEKLIYDVAGLPAIKGRDLVSSLVEQADPFQPSYVLGEEAQTLTEKGDGHGRRWEIKTGRETSITCGAVIVTGGIGTFTPRRLPAGEEFLDRGLDYFVPDPEGYEGKDVIIVGGGDSALDWALMLEQVARKVTLVHRREAFRAHAATVDTVRASSVEIITNAELETLNGTQAVEGAVVRVKGEGATRELDCQRVVAALGFTANLGPLREWGVDLHDNRHLVVDSSMRTSRAGIYAAGDITDYEGKVRLISVGFGEVATAVNNAGVFIDPEAQLFPGHSTDADPRVPVSA